MKVLSLALVLVLVLLPLCQSQIIITEIMYNNPLHDELEYVELHNPASTGRIVNNWKFTSGIDYQFPSAPSIVVPANDYIIVVKNLTVFSHYYPFVDSSKIYGGYVASLSDSGETLTLSDQQNKISSSVTYQTELPWPPTADGWGASIEVICPTGDLNNALNWHGSLLPLTYDPKLYLSGTPAQKNSWISCPFPDNSNEPKVVISEIQYSPVDEVTYEEVHEFIELYNMEPAAVDVSGWRLSSYEGLRFLFPVGSSIPASSYVVVAKDIAAFTAVYGSGITVFGPYSGEMDNGGSKILLEDDSGRIVDAAIYNDEFPWPMGTDSFGANDAHLALFNSSFVPITDHRFKGLSSQRIANGQTGLQPFNWDAAFPTPGQPNTVRNSVIPPILLKIETNPPLDKITAVVEFNFTFYVGAGPLTSAKIEFYLWNWNADIFEDPPGARLQSADLTLLSTDGDQATYTYFFTSSHPAHSIIRYRIAFSNSIGAYLSPRPTDPYRWHAFFLHPTFPKEIPTYYVFASHGRWGEMENNVAGLFRTPCSSNFPWDETVPVVFVHEGVVVPAYARYQGNGDKRRWGNSVPVWPYVKPDIIAVDKANDTLYHGLQANNWRIKLPKYHRIANQGVILVRRMWERVVSGLWCSEMDSPMTYSLMNDAGIRTSKSRNVRFFVNGGYLQYGIEVEHVDEFFWKNMIDEQDLACDLQPREPRLGEGWKQRARWNPTNYTYASMKPMYDECPGTRNLSILWDENYNRQTWNNIYGDSSLPIQQLVAEMDVVRRSNNVTYQRQWLADHFDIDWFTTYWGVYQFTGGTDDIAHNYYLYRRESDGRYIQVTWDTDRHYYTQNVNLMSGTSNVTNSYNTLKSMILQAYKQEYFTKLRTFMAPGNLLSKEKLQERLDAVMSSFETSEFTLQRANFTPSRLTQCYNHFQQFFTNRTNYIIPIAGAPIVGPNPLYTCPTTKPTLTRQTTTSLPYPLGKQHPPVAVQPWTEYLYIGWPVPNAYGQSDPITYKLEYRTTPSSAFVELYSGAENTFNHTSLPLGTSYDYRVTATSTLGQSVSQIVTLSTLTHTPTASPLPTAPTATQGPVESSSSSEVELSESFGVALQCSVLLVVLSILALL